MANLRTALRALPRAEDIDDRAAIDVDAAMQRADEADAREAADAAAQRESYRVAVEAAEARARLRDADDDRLAQAFNIVAFCEAQRGRAVLSRKGAATATLIKRLLDALFDDDAPVVYPQFVANALGGRSALDMEAITAAIAGAPDAPPAAEAEEPAPAPAAASEASATSADAEQPEDTR